MGYIGSTTGGVKGAAAAGHAVTVDAGCEVLAAGGNAYDAAIAAFFAACVAEPVLASLGGGGFLLAQTAAGRQQLFDFFVQTPGQKKSLADIDFSPIWADFGTLKKLRIHLKGVVTQFLQGAVQNAVTVVIGHCRCADITPAEGR